MSIKFRLTPSNIILQQPRSQGLSSSRPLSLAPGDGKKRDPGNEVDSTGWPNVWNMLNGNIVFVYSGPKSDAQSRQTSVTCHPRDCARTTVFSRLNAGPRINAGFK